RPAARMPAQHAAVLIAIVLAAGCTQPAVRATAGSPIEHQWIADAVTPQEGIAGRVADSTTVRLLTTGHRLISIDLFAHRVSPVPLREVAEDEHLSGLAQRTDGSLWTLSGWSTLVRVNTDGGLGPRRTLAVRLAGVQGGFDAPVF